MMTYGEDKQFDAAYTYGLERIEVEDLDETRPESQDPLYYLYDGLGSVAYMVKPDGNTRDHYRYDEFGKPAPGNSKLSEDGRINLNNTFGYTGEMWDEESELLFLRARYYEPETGRFLSRDSYQGELGNPLSRNLYTYVGNNPINAIDPSGHVTLRVNDIEKHLKSLRNDDGINTATLRDLAGSIGGKFTQNELKKYEVVTFKQKQHYFYHDHWWVENGKIRLSLRKFAHALGLGISWSGTGARQVINLSYGQAQIWLLNADFAGVGHEAILTIDSSNNVDYWSFWPNTDLWDWTPFGSDAAEDNLHPQLHDNINRPVFTNIMPYIQDLRDEQGANLYRSAVIINATDKQIAAINEYARHIENNDPNYNLATYNCLTFVQGALNQAGVKSPSGTVPDKWHQEMRDLYGGIDLNN